MIRLVYLVLILSAVSSCRNENPEKPVVAGTGSTIQHYLERESKALTNSRSIIEKTVEINGNRETKLIENPDWKKELGILSGPGDDSLYWDEKFSSEQTDSAGYSVITYIALKDDFPLRYVRIVLRDESLQELFTHTVSETALYHSEKNSRYISGELIESTGIMKVMGLKPYTWFFRSDIRDGF